jgi:hypothetical protein
VSTLFRKYEISSTTQYLFIFSSEESVPEKCTVTNHSKLSLGIPQNKENATGETWNEGPFPHLLPIPRNIIRDPFKAYNEEPVHTLATYFI